MTSIALRELRNALERQHRLALNEIDAAIERELDHYRRALLRNSEGCTTAAEVRENIREEAEAAIAADELAAVVERILERADAALLAELQRAPVERVL